MVRAIPRRVSLKSMTPYRDARGRFTRDTSQRQVYAEEFCVDREEGVKPEGPVQGEKETRSDDGLAKTPLSIRPYARLLTMLGEQLLKNERVALVELIKNSYDADASRVDVMFEGFANDMTMRPGVTDRGAG